MVLWSGEESQATEQEILREAEWGETVVAVCRKHGISQQTFYLWKKKYVGLGLSELRELRQLREEDAKPKRLVADMSLDRHVLQEIVAKSCEASSATRVGGVGASRPPVSQRRVAGLIPVERGTLRYQHHRDLQEALRVRLRELACSRVRYGYRRLTAANSSSLWCEIPEADATGLPGNTRT